MARTLTHEEAKAFYDRFGARQDWQAFYEDRATAELLAHAEFERARSVLEFGCGTGRFARRLLCRHLPDDASYWAVDVSETMVGLARARLARWPGRARVDLASGEPRLTAADASADRFVANYVLDLLSDDDIRALIREARRVLAPGGLLCLVSLTQGDSRASRLVTRAWRGLFALDPKLVGGCRPIDLRRYLVPEHWRLRHHATVSNFGITSQVVVAARRPNGR